MDPTWVAAIIGSGGLGVMARGIYTGVKDWRSGKHAHEVEMNTTALQQRDQAVAARIAYHEYAALLRRILIEHGTPLDDIPDWPEV